MCRDESLAASRYIPSPHEPCPNPYEPKVLQKSVSISPRRHHYQEKTGIKGRHP